MSELEKRRGLFRIKEQIDNAQRHNMGMPNLMLFRSSTHVLVVAFYDNIWQAAEFGYGAESAALWSVDEVAVVNDATDKVARIGLTNFNGFKGAHQSLDVLLETCVSRTYDEARFWQRNIEPPLVSAFSHNPGVVKDLAIKLNRLY